MDPSVNIGTRGSQLALWQANWVRSELRNRFSETAFRLIEIKTQGDKIVDVPLAQVGGKGLFVKEIEQALLDGRIDLAVHSMKDMPSVVPPGLCIAAVPRRETPGDVLIAKARRRFAELGPGSRIGTSSLRRGAQLLHARPDLQIVPLRGNLDTRLKKLQREGLDAIVLAAAGVKRLGLEHRISEYLDFDTMLPAVGQGALCVQAREGDARILPMVQQLDHDASRAAVLGERAFLGRLEGSCQVPIAGYAEVSGDRLELTGLVAAVDGSELVKGSLKGTAATAEDTGVCLAELLLGRGARSILEALKATTVDHHAS
jgi:hydroxymethylbilane synthase